MEQGVNNSDMKNEENQDLFTISSQSLLEDDLNSQSEEESSPLQVDFQFINSYSQAPLPKSSELGKRIIEDSPNSQIQEKKNFLFKKYCSISPVKIKKQLFFKNNLTKVLRFNLVKQSEEADQNISKVHNACSIKLNKLNQRLKQYEKMKNQLCKSEVLKDKDDKEEYFLAKRKRVESKAKNSKAIEKVKDI